MQFQEARLSGKTEIGERPGHQAVMTHDQEEKLVEYGAAMGIGHGMSTIPTVCRNDVRQTQNTIQKGQTISW